MRRLTKPVAIVIVAMLAAGFLLLRATGKPAAPQQPIEFDHWQHVTKKDGPELDCSFCHAHADKSPHATIPNVDTCMICHESERAESAEIQKLSAFSKRGEQPPWVPFIASFSSFMDETTQLADLILPDHTYLESWDIGATQAIKAGAVATITRPVVAPEFNTRQTADVLIALSRELGQPLAFDSAEAMVKQAGSALAKGRGSVGAKEPEEFMEKLIEQGVWAEEAEPQKPDDIKPAVERLKSNVLADLNALKSRPVKERNVTNSEYPFTLLTYEHAALGFGEQANLPWLQELPDPMTTVMWGSWVEINPKAAASLGIADGDLVEVATAHGSVQVPAVVYPAIRPDVIAIPFGQGHTAFGRYARGRGANAALLNPLASATDEGRILSARVSRVKGEAKLVRFGTELLERVENDRSR